MVTPRILGPDGQPIRTDDLREPQTSHVMQLRNEIAGHPSRGLTPSRLATILDSAERGDTVAQCELFEDMEEKDGHIASEMLKRRNAVCSLDFDVVPPPSPYAAEKKAAKQVLEWLAELDGWEEMLFDATDAIGKGFCCLEIEWQMLDGVWLPKSITHRPQSWFQLYRGYRQEIRLRDNSADGAVLQPFGWIVHQQKAKSGYLERAALFRVLVWPYLFKNYSVADLAEFLETYGWPIRIGKYPGGASEKEKMTLLRALTSLARNAGGIMPDGMSVDFEDAVSGDADAFQLMIDWCERTQSKTILGGTLTSQADGKTSTNALGNVHNEVRKDLRNGDAKALAATLTRDLIYPIAALNGLASNVRRGPRLRFDTKDRKDIAAFATSLPSLVGMGFRVPRQWAQEEVGIPEPESDDDDLLKPVATPKQSVPAGEEALATATARRQTPPDPPALQAQLLDTRLQVSTDAWIGKIRDLVAASSSLEQIRDGLVALAPQMSLEQYTATMREALAAAALAGRYEILREAGSV